MQSNLSNLMLYNLVSIILFPKIISNAINKDILFSYPMKLGSYHNFRRIRCYFLHLIPDVRPMRQSALSMDFAKNCPTFLKGIYPEFQVIRGFSQKILADLLSYDQIHR